MRNSELKRRIQRLENGGENVATRHVVFIMDSMSKEEIQKKDEEVKDLRSRGRDVLVVHFCDGNSDS